MKFEQGKDERGKDERDAVGFWLTCKRRLFVPGQVRLVYHSAGGAREVGEDLFGRGGDKGSRLLVRNGCSRYHCYEAGVCDDEEKEMVPIYGGTKLKRLQSLNLGHLTVAPSKKSRRPRRATI